MGFLLLPSVALADNRFNTHRERDRGDRYDHRDDRDRRDNRGRVDIEIRGGGYGRAPVVREERVWIEPVYRTVTERRWVEATYRTVSDRVWFQPVVRREVYDRVWEPDRYEWRETVCWEHGRRVVRGATVLVERGHFEDRCRDVVIAPGHYEDRPRQELVCAGHWEDCTRQELVVPGRWETRCDPRPVESHARIDVRFPIR